MTSRREDGDRKPKTPAQNRPVSTMSLVSRFHLRLTRRASAGIQSSPNSLSATTTFLFHKIRFAHRPSSQGSQSSEMAQHSEFMERWLEGFDGHQFYTRTYPATFPKAVVVFVHGFAEHIGRYEHVHTKYPMHSITLFAYDQRGYGRTALDSAHRSKDASYGKTNWNLALQDIDFFVKHAAKEYPNTPLFLMGHSAVRNSSSVHITVQLTILKGGALALAYFTRNAPPPSPEGPKLISGVVCSSPFITLTNPTPKLLRWTGSKVASITPYMTFPADVGAEVCTRPESTKAWDS